MSALGDTVCVVSLWILLGLFILALYYRADKWLGIKVAQAQSRKIAQTMLHCKFDAPGSSDAFCAGCKEKSCVNWSPTRKRR